MSHQSPLIRPSLWVALFALAYLGLTAPLVLSLMAEMHHAPAGAVLVWMVAWGPGALLALLMGHLAARLERAVEGCRRPRGWLWMLHALGLDLSAHYALMALWAPLLVLGGLARGRALGDVDEVLGAAMAWLPLGVGLALTLLTGAALRRRSEGRMPDLPLLPARVPSMVLVIFSLGLPLGLGWGASIALLASENLWGPRGSTVLLLVVLGLGLALSLGTAWVWSRVRRRLRAWPGAHYKGGTLERAAGAWGLAGGLLILQWAPVYLVTLLPGAWDVGLGWEYGVALLSTGLILAGLWMISPVWVPRRA